MLIDDKSFAVGWRLSGERLRRLFAFGWHRLELEGNVQVTLNEQRPAQVSPHALEHRCANVKPTVRAFVQTTEGALHGIHERARLELFEDGDPRGRFLRLLDAEPRRGEVEQRAQLGKQEWKDASLLWSSFFVASVHENVGLARVAMQIAVQDTRSLSVHFLDQAFCVIYSGLELLGGEFPTSVQVTASQRAPVVAVDDAVGVKHRDNLEYKVLSQQHSLLVIRVSQEEQDASHHPGAHGLAGMHSRGNYHALLLRLA